MNYSTITDKAIVLDLDETLVHSIEDFDSLKSLQIYDDPKLADLRSRVYLIIIDDVVDRRGTGSKTKIWGIKRPYLSEFLQFCFKYFRTVVVWSAGQLRYVHGIVNIAFKDIEDTHIIYSWDDCDIKTKLVKKPLMKMISEISGISTYLNLTNTFVIDDRKSTFQDNPNNGILIPAYKPEPSIEGIQMHDDNLLRLMNWFMLPEVINSSDVRSLNKNNIFINSSIIPSLPIEKKENDDKNQANLSFLKFLSFD